MSEAKQETEYFYELTPEKILQAVEHLGVRCTGRCLSLQSMENRVYEVEIEVDEQTPVRDPSERFRVVKFYRPGRWSKEQILEEHEYLFDLKEQEIPVVAPDRDSSGQSLFLAPEIKIWFAVFPKQGGRSPTELSDEDLLQVGRLLARLHTVGSLKPANQRLTLSPQTYGHDNLRYLVEQQKIPADVQPHYVNVVEQICQFITPWFEDVPIQRIHGDAHLGNLLWGRTGAFWVDFDDMVRGPCVQDLWLVALGRDEEAKRRLDVLLSGYESMRRFDRTTLMLIEPLRALRMIHYATWIAKRWEDPAFQRTFPDFGSNRYWREQISDLQDQLRFMQYGEEV